jgi:PQQ-like domain
LVSATAVIALGLPLILITRPQAPQTPPASSVVASPVTTLGPLWTQAEVGMSGDFSASGGDIVLADSDMLFVADGFGGGMSDNRVSAFDVRSGELIWEREDLAGVGEEDVFLQALADGTLVASGQYQTITAVDPQAGSTSWSYAFPAEYGAKRSSVSDGVLYVSTGTSHEGNTQPPIVYAIDIEEGALLWETALSEGTDAQWHKPPIADGVVYVSSTLSHPGSATGNMVHALDVASGEILWATDIGGEQGFSFYPSLISGELLITYSPEGSTLALRSSDGSTAWAQPGVFPLAVGPDGAIYGGGDGVVVLDHVNGETTTLLDEEEVGFSATGGIIQDDQLVLTSDRDALGYDLMAEVPEWRIHTPPAAAPAAVTSEVIAVPIGHPRGISVFAVP